MPNERMLDMAEAQLIGYAAGRDNESIEDFIGAMHLSKGEWEDLKAFGYFVDQGLREEIDALFEAQEEDDENND